MELRPYKAEELFDWVTSDDSDFLLLDVRNNEEFGRFKVEGPYLKKMINVPYMEFIEHEEQSVAQVPKGEKIRIVCAKEGSAKYVGEILVQPWLGRCGLPGGRHLILGQHAGAEVDQRRKWLPALSVHPAGKSLLQLRPALRGRNGAVRPHAQCGVLRNFCRPARLRMVKTFETHLQADYISPAVSGFPKRPGRQSSATKMIFKAPFSATSP